MEQNKKNKKMVVIILGPPGSGKGTQAGLVSEKFNLYHFETSKMLERRLMSAKEGEFEEVGIKKYSLLKEKENWLAGKLVEPLLVSFWAKKEIKKLSEEGNNLIFSATPRSVEEAEEIIPFLDGLYGKEAIIVFWLELKEEDSIWRNSHRKICQLMRHSILYSKETEGLTLCPLDGSKLLKREGLDDPETIKVRLREYKERTFPVIEFLNKRGIKVEIIDGCPSPAVVFESIVKKIEG